MVRAGFSAAVSAPGKPSVRNPHLGVVRCFRNPLTPDDLATRSKFGAELAPGSKIIFEKRAETGPGAWRAAGGVRQYGQPAATRVPVRAEVRNLLPSPPLFRPGQ
ncbi:hypothetical protein GCM10009642_00090 [Nocardiopsis metallicus]